MNPYLRAAQKHSAVQAQALERLASRLEKSKREPDRAQRLRAKAQDLQRARSASVPQPRTQP